MSPKPSKPSRHFEHSSEIGHKNPYLARARFINVAFRQGVERLLFHHLKVGAEAISLRRLWTVFESSFAPRVRKVNVQADVSEELSQASVLENTSTISLGLEKLPSLTTLYLGYMLEREATLEGANFSAPTF